MAKVMRAWWAMPPTALISLAWLLTYLGFRVCYLSQAHHAENARLRSLALPWLFFALEILLLLPNALPYCLRIIALRPANRSSHRLNGQEVPNVDVLVTTCNEDVDVVLDTVRAACDLDYPADRFRVIVCDDGGSSALRSTITTLVENHTNLFYTSRVKGAVKDYKAGNLNYGLQHSASLLGLPAVEREISEASLSSNSLGTHRPATISSATTPFGSNCVSELSLIRQTPPWGEYVAGLDADMIPEPHWLRTILPHLIRDPSMALACPPQTFYDIPTNDPLTQKMSQFAGMSEVVNDALGHADCLGSGYVMRRTAIEDIGGFPVESISEDVCCSATLLGAGWKTAFVQVPLQYGSVPESYLGHVKQRTRWFVGHIQTAKLFNLRLWGPRGRHLNAAQRLAGLTFDLRQLVQVLLALNYIIMPFVLLSGSPLVFWETDAQLKNLIRLVSVWTASHWLHSAVMGAIAGIGNGDYDIRIASYDSEMEQWLSPYIFLAFLRSFILPEALGGATMGFRASGSLKNDLLERDSLRRAPLLRRLRITLFSHLAIIHVVFIVACLAGVGLNFARAFSSANIPNAYSRVELHTTINRLAFLVTRLGWPPLFWLQHVVSASVPLRYTIWPPTTPDREMLLNRDPKTGVAHPQPENRVPKVEGWGFGQYVRACFVIVYTLVLFVANELVDLKL